MAPDMGSLYWEMAHSNLSRDKKDHFCRDSFWAGLPSPTWLWYCNWGAWCSTFLLQRCIIQWQLCTVNGPPASAKTERFKLNDWKVTENGGVWPCKMLNCMKIASSHANLWNYRPKGLPLTKQGCTRQNCMNHKPPSFKYIFTLCQCLSRLPTVV